MSISSKVATSPPYLGSLSPPQITLTSGFGRPPIQPSPLVRLQLEGWSPPAPCARTPPAAAESPMLFLVSCTCSVPRPPRNKWVTSGGKKNLPNSIAVYQLATLGAVVSDPRTSLPRLGVLFSKIQYEVRSLSHKEVSAKRSGLPLHQPKSPDLHTHILTSKVELLSAVTLQPAHRHFLPAGMLQCPAIRPQRYTRCTTAVVAVCGSWRCRLIQVAPFLQ